MPRLRRYIAAVRPSSQNQTVPGERLEIPGVERGQFCAATDRHRRNHAIRQGAGATARLVEQARGQRGIGGQERFGVGGNLAGEGFRCGIHRPAQEFRPGNGADVGGFAGRRLGGELCVCGRPGHGGLNHEVGVAMDHAARVGRSTPGFPNEVHPRRRLRRVEPEMFL